MNRRSRILLGVSVALLTAASLHLTVGDRFHHRAFGRHGTERCGGHWGERNHEPNAKTPQPDRQF